MRHAISMALELTNKNAGEVYISESGHLEFSYSASAGQVLNKASEYQWEKHSDLWLALLLQSDW